MVRETDIHKEVERKAGSIKFYTSKKCKCYVGRGSQGELEVNTEAVVGLMPGVCYIFHMDDMCDFERVM